MEIFPLEPEFALVQRSNHSNQLAQTRASWQHPNHLAWNVPQDELERLAAEHGKEIKPHRDGTRSFYLDAPGGNSVEIIAITGSKYEEMIRPA